MHNQTDKKIAIVHDFLLYPGGAEKVLFALSEIYPDAPIYTLLFNESTMGKYVSGKDIRTSFLQKLPAVVRNRPRFLLPLLPIAPETFDLRDFDIVISSSGAWSKGIVTRLHTTHIAYIHSPMRFVWDYNETYAKEIRGKEPGFFLRRLLSRTRLWDRQAADRPDHMIANSIYTQKRIKKYYRRDADVMYPPAIGEEGRSTGQEERGKDRKEKTQKQLRGYFLVVSRLSEYKNVKLAVQTFNKLNLDLVVLGEGRERKYLEKIANKNITFTGYVSEKIKRLYLEHARALIFPSEDDFGIVAVEALAQKTPVIALRKGATEEIVLQGITGEFFDEPETGLVADAVRRFLEREGSYDEEQMSQTANRFTKELFKEKIQRYVNEVQDKII